MEANTKKATDCYRGAQNLSFHKIWSQNPSQRLGMVKFWAHSLQWFWFNSRLEIYFVEPAGQVLTNISYTTANRSRLYCSYNYLVTIGCWLFECFFECFQSCLSLILFTWGKSLDVTITHDSFDLSIQEPSSAHWTSLYMRPPFPSRPPTLDMGPHCTGTPLHWSPVQTCLREDSPTGTDILWHHVQLARGWGWNGFLYKLWWFVLVKQSKIWWIISDKCDFVENVKWMF